MRAAEAIAILRRKDELLLELPERIGALLRKHAKEIWPGDNALPRDGEDAKDTPATGTPVWPERGR